LNLILNNLVHSLPNIVHGDTLLNPFHKNRKGDELATFDYIVSNPPFNVDFSDTRDTLAGENYKKRFWAGVPNIPNQDKDSMSVYLMFLQHIIYSLGDKAKAAMELGQIIYAGKYNMPDYELILDSGCELAIESMMISHSPEVKENLESSGIPVMIDRSSYESHPLGRSEWIKLYGLLTGYEDKADEFFRQQVEMAESVLLDDMDENGNKSSDGMSSVEVGNAGEFEVQGKTVAFFYITSSGGVNVRKSGDYVSKMIELAGGKYIFDNLGDPETATATEVIQMEEFYAAAKEADYLIYNSTIDGELRSIDDLLEKSSLLADFKAVKQGNVFCTSKNMYQETSETGRMILDMNKMLCGDEDIEFLYKLEK